MFRLLRPEFREQLKQSSCKVAIPDEDAGKERIIPIRREGEEATAAHYVAVAADAADDAEAAAAAEGKAAAAPPPPAAPARRQHSSMKRLLLLARPVAQRKQANRLGVEVLGEDIMPACWSRGHT